MCTNSEEDVQHYKEIQTQEEVEQYFLGFISFIDCTGQQIPRFADKNRRTIFYSDKKKRHMVKNHITVDNRDYILSQSM
jgi:hypothetical protein